MSRPSGDRSGVSPVIAIILLVAITVALTAVLYIVVTNIAQQVNTPAPRVFIGDEQHPTTDNTTFTIQGTSEARPQIEFRLKLFIDGVEDVPSRNAPLVPGTIGNLTYDDRDGGGTVSQGDMFLVHVAVDHTYDLLLFWKEDLVTEVTWRQT